MTTALAYIESGLSKIGMLRAGETVSAEDAALGLLRLNTLLDAMENEGMFGFSTLNTTFTLPASTTSRTIGPAQQIALVRPIRLLNGGFSLVGEISYPLTVITEAEYNAISLKSSVSSVAPSVCFYDGGSPTGVVYFWPLCATACSVTIITPTAKSTATDTTTDLVFPPGYDRYIENALGVEMAPDFNVDPSVQLLRTTANAKRLIKRSNGRTPQMGMVNIGNNRVGSPVGDWISGYSL
tara:strand:- start:595 stop:1311 length:717 start_codon:yes stop_codon:yes gene_type:complete